MTTFPKGFLELTETWPVDVELKDGEGRLIGIPNQKLNSAMMARKPVKLTLEDDRTFMITIDGVDGHFVIIGSVDGGYSVFVKGSSEKLVD